MKIVHIESGLGNQMLSYCEYLALKKVNPNDDIYIETITYDVPQANETICQWNGYELQRIFGIEVPNIKTVIKPGQWDILMNEIVSSEFWKRNWNYPVYFPRAFKKIGIDLVDVHCDYEDPMFVKKHTLKKGSLNYFIKTTRLYDFLKRKHYKRNEKKILVQGNYKEQLFIKSNESIFAGQKLLFKFKTAGIELIEKEVREAFTFPAMTNKQDIEAAQLIQSCNSVAIHARRGDLLTENYPLYKFGYFKRAVRFIRKKVESPVFFIFCDAGSVEWAKNNGNILGLNMKKDEVHFIDWNDALNSYRDMQLMAMCKHQVITHSSFGWWGAWLNTNPNKITCSPKSIYLTTHSF